MQTISLLACALFLVLFFVFLMDNFIKPQGWEGPLCAFFLTSHCIEALLRKKRQKEVTLWRFFTGQAVGSDALFACLFNLPEILLPPW